MTSSTPQPIHPLAPWDGIRVQDASARTRLRWEIGIVLAVTLGKSAVYSLLALVRRLMAPQPLSSQTAQLNPTLDAQPVWDVIYGLLDIFFDLALVALVIFLLWEPGRNALRAIGLDLRRFGSDLGRAAIVAAIIGIPGIGLYLVGKSLGLTVAVAASPGALAWWTIPVLLLSALRAGLIEEVVLLGYLFDRFRRLGVGPWATIVTAALIRGAYHSYQGFGPIVGNIAMGLVFGWAYRRWGRVMPLVIAHTLIDAVAFVGYPLALAWWPALFAAS